MKIHTSVKFSGRIIGYHYEFDTAMSESELIEYKDKVFQFAISRFKQKNDKDFHEDFARCVYFEAYFFRGNEKVIIDKKFKKVEIEVNVIAKKAKYTIGKMYVDGEYFCDTLEDRVRPDGIKVFRETSIPEGNYKIKLTYSDRFKKVIPIICDVPNFEGIRIGKNTEVGKLSDSLKTFNELMSLLTDSEESITIKIH